MDNFSDYLIAMIMVAFLPALFEETLFRGGLQNLLSRWFKKPILRWAATKNAEILTADRIGPLAAPGVSAGD